MNNNEKIKALLRAEQRLAAIINELEAHRDELPAGAFRHLTTAENLLQNKRANLERNGK